MGKAIHECLYKTAPLAAENLIRVDKATADLLKNTMSTLDSLRLATTPSTTRALERAEVSMIGKLAFAPSIDPPGLIRQVKSARMPLGRVEFIESYEEFTYAMILERFEIQCRTFACSPHNMARMLYFLVFLFQSDSLHLQYGDTTCSERID